MTARTSDQTRRVRIGLEKLLADPPAEVKKARLGLLANQASVGPEYRHAATLIDWNLPGGLKKLFGPQHGFAGEKQDNMVESDHGREANTGRVIYSLYGRTRIPLPEMFENLDLLLIDLVDVGTRVYTFAQTMSYCLEEAGKKNIKVLVLDRPNPIGGMEVEGNLLAPDCASFVGLHPIPMRHGLTMGELAGFICARLANPPELEVIRMEGWTRDMYFPQCRLPWVLPSPNMPDPITAWVYPGQVLWEGTNISEGRGTTRPFHLFGAPFIDSARLMEEIKPRNLKGAFFRPAVFEPMFHKFQGQVCHGLEIHPENPRTFKPYLTSLVLLETIRRLYPDQFAWKKPPYEYEFTRQPIDLILGDKSIRQGLEQGLDAETLEQSWHRDLQRFQKEREGFLLYDPPLSQ